MRDGVRSCCVALSGSPQTTRRRADGVEGSHRLTVRACCDALSCSQSDALKGKTTGDLSQTLIRDFRCIPNVAKTPQATCFLQRMTSHAHEQTSNHVRVLRISGGSIRGRHDGVDSPPFVVVRRPPPRAQARRPQRSTGAHPQRDRIQSWRGCDHHPMPNL